MLETKNLVKIYKPKKGVPVRALNGISIRFPDKGMVFLLGKSGSGKSTLLNVLGGLDKYNEGEILIKGKSSKKFKQKDFDSYRNTYVGFIFQEYNILEEFTVGANIALALELQGKKATDEEINRILKEVDLDGYGNRRPNELSGGQKQRVAIARALVKNPKIIMADEPSGALDSETGKQVFETLKNLSKEKLVIVVSHDRDFAMNYADRIIELADGQVISDISNTGAEPEAIEETKEGITLQGATASVPMGYHLTEEDRIAINEYIDKLKSGVVLEFKDDLVSESSKSSGFVPTTEESIKNEDRSPLALIKSKLSMKHSFKIGGSGLKHKKFRLVMTIILSTIAFTLFGLVDTFSSYDHIYTTTNSIYDSNVNYAAISKLQPVGDEDYYIFNTRFDEEEIKDMTNATNIDFSGVVSNGDYSFGANVHDVSYESEAKLYLKGFGGITEVTEKSLKAFGYKLASGRMPDGDKHEIIISEFVAETFIYYGYRDVNSYSDKKIKKSSDMIGKKLLISGKEYEIVGIVDTDFDTSRYEGIFDYSEDKSSAELILQYVLSEEYRYATEYSYTGLMMVGEGYIQNHYTEINFVSDEGYSHFYNENYGFGSYRYAKLENIDKDLILWLDGERETLGEKEIIVSSDNLMDLLVHLDENGELIFNERYADATFTYENYGTGTCKDGYKIVGVINVDKKNGWDYYGTIVISDDMFKDEFDYLLGNYNFALGAMPEDKDGIKDLARFCYEEMKDYGYAFENPTSFELDALKELFEGLAQVFVWIGVFFAVFASILLSNFIATSISYKKQEIGILRAIGARGNDVFRIFFAEAFIIAMINFVLSFAGTGLATYFINDAIRDAGLLVTVLNFGIRQFIVLILISIAVAIIASFLPVKKIASKKPIDAIRNR